MSQLDVSLRQIIDVLVVNGPLNLAELCAAVNKVRASVSQAALSQKGVSGYVSRWKVGNPHGLPQLFNFDPIERKYLIAQAGIDVRNGVPGAVTFYPKKKNSTAPQGLPATQTPVRKPDVLSAAMVAILHSHGKPMKAGELTAEVTKVLHRGYSQGSVASYLSTFLEGNPAGNEALFKRVSRGTYSISDYALSMKLETDHTVDLRDRVLKEVGKSIVPKAPYIMTSDELDTLHRIRAERHYQFRLARRQKLNLTIPAS